MKDVTTSRAPSCSSLVTCHLSLLLLLVASPALADDLSLKDGRKISGTIVGFENGMFRVETEYGFVLVRKDKVSSIKVTEGGAKEAPENSKVPASEARNSGKGLAESPTSASGEPSRTDRKEFPEDRRANSVATSSTSSIPPPAITPPPPAPVSRPVNEPMPAHVLEHVEGNDYFNDTFHFAMYKPPGWNLYEELPRGKVSAIVAIATEDEQTLLFVDRQVWSGTPNLKDDSVEANLRRTYQNYKMESESNTTIDGRPAIRRDFTGVMDGAEWHGVAVRVAQGSTIFGIIGMTSAESFQFQEAVVNKILKSFHFLPAISEAASARQRSAGL